MKNFSNILVVRTAFPCFLGNSLDIGHHTYSTASMRPFEGGSWLAIGLHIVEYTGRIAGMVD